MLLLFFFKAQESEVHIEEDLDLKWTFRHILDEEEKMMRLRSNFLKKGTG